MKTVDFSKAKFEDIDGKEIIIPEAHKALANEIYANTNDIGMLDIAQKIYKGQKVELEDTQIDSIKTIMTQKIKAIAAKGFLEAIESKK